MAQGTELHFTKSGIRIQPISVDYESDKTNYDFARVELSRAAGDHINEYSSVPEAVEIVVGERKLCDVYIGEDSLTLDDKRAYLELLDGRKVLERGIVDYQENSTTLRNIVDWFAEAVEDADTGNVIRDIRLVGDVDEDQKTEDFKQFAVDSANFGPEDADNLEEGSVMDTVANYGAWQTRAIAGLGPLPNVEEGGFDFDQINLAQVLYIIEERFELSSYMTDNRVLEIGDPEVVSNMYAAGEDSHMWEITDYNLTSNPNSVRMVQVKGGYTKVNSYDEATDGTDFSDGVYTDDVQMWAFASTEPPYTLFEGDDLSIDEVTRRHNSHTKVEGRVVPVRHTNETGKEALRKVAIRRLMKELVQKVTGSIKINPLKSSTNGGYPHDIRVGDSIGVFPPDEEHCGKGVIPENLFTVTGIRHRLDGKRGWELELQLSRIPRTKIYAAAHGWPRIPDAGSDYENYEKYYAKTMEYDRGNVVLGQDDYK